MMRSVDSGQGVEVGAISRDREARTLGLELRCKRSVLVVGDAGVGKRALIESVKIAKEVDWKSLAGSSKTYRDFALGFQRSVSESKQVYIDSLDLLVVLCDKPELLWGDEVDLDGVDSPVTTLSERMETGNFALVATSPERLSRRILTEVGKMSLLKLRPMTPEHTRRFLRASRSNLEKTYNVRVMDSSIEAAVDLASEYLTMGNLPKEAIDLLEEACARVNKASGSLVIEDNLIQVLASWTRINLDRLRTRKLKTQPQVVRAQKVSHFQRVMSEHSLAEMQRGSPLGTSCLAKSMESPFSPTSPPVYI